MSFFANTRKPSGFGGKVMVSMMNVGHSALANWAMQFLDISDDAKILDCGCGGGANIAKLLKKFPQSVVKGMDYSAISVEKAQKHNQKEIATERCAIWKDSVEKINLESGILDAVTAFETVYFWSDLPLCFREIYRVLKVNGTFLICNECSGETKKEQKWLEKIDGMVIYTDVQLKAYLAQVGFHNIKIYKNNKGWLCITAKK